MSQYLSFYPNAQPLPGALKLMLSTTAYRYILEQRQEPDLFLCKLSQSRTLIAVPGIKAEELDLYFPQYVLTCQVKPEGLFIKHMKQPKLRNQSIAMRFGVCFQLASELMISCVLTDYAKYTGYIGGRVVPLDLVKMQNCGSTAAFMLAEARKTRAATDGEEIPEETEEYIPTRSLSRLLDAAQRYAQLNADLEQQTAMRSSILPYDNLRGSDHQRKDRSLYQVDIEQLPEDWTLTPNKTHLELMDIGEQTHTVQVVDIEQKSNGYTLTLLFKQQMDRDQLSSYGQLRLSASSVNLDVQTAAIEKIRSGEAAAKYMDLVLGQRGSLGFAPERPEAFLARLQQEDRPPNASQLEAIEKGIRARDICAVVGPPGTGKTTVILQWVRYFVRQEHKRVLVSSQTNAAVDNVLARFAEEGGIDMLRLGHAETLSAAVAPYAFENKVKHMRENIHTASNQNIENLQILTEPWKAYEELVDKALEQLELCRKCYREFQAEAQGLLPYLTMLTQLRQAHEKLAQKILRRTATLHRLAEKLTRHENSRGFLRLITGLLYPFRKARLRKVYSALQQLRSEEQESLQVYKANYNHYENALELLRTNVYSSLERSHQQLQQHIVRLGAKPFPDPRDIWDLFGGSRSILPTEPQHLAGLKQQVQWDLRRAEELTDILSDWDEEMGSKQNYALSDIITDSVQLVGATCIGIQSQKRFANMDFDVTIIDEAGQILIQSALVPMSVSNKVIMLGDDKQLAPYITKEMRQLCESNPIPLDSQLMDKSLFEYLLAGLPAENRVMLDTQYRMPAQIADVLSHEFYGGKYLSPDFKRDLPGVIPVLSDKPFVIIDTSGLAERFESAENKSVYNKTECAVLLALMEHLSRQPDFDPDQVGLITPHKPQVERLRAGLKKLLPDRPTDDMVMTLDSCQGQEKDIILFCINRSKRNPREDTERIGFMQDLRRLNVALSRCKKTLVLVGDMEYLCGCTFEGINRQGDYVDERPFAALMQTLTELPGEGKAERITVQTMLRRLKGAKT